MSTRGVLGKRHCLRCCQPLSVNLDHRVSGGQEKRRQIGVEPASVTVCNIMFLCQHLGVAPEEGAYSREIKCQIPHISPPTLSTSAKVAKRGAYMRDTTVYSSSSSRRPISSRYKVQELTRSVIVLLSSAQSVPQISNSCLSDSLSSSWCPVLCLHLHEDIHVRCEGGREGDGCSNLNIFLLSQTVYVHMHIYVPRNLGICTFSESRNCVPISRLRSQS